MTSRRFCGGRAPPHQREQKPFLADLIFGWNFQIVEEQFVGRMIDHVRDRLDRRYQLFLSPMLIRRPIGLP